MISLVATTRVGAQERTPPLQPLRIAGEYALSTVGLAAGGEAGLATAAGIAYLVRGHGGDIHTPGLKRMAWATIVLGAGAGSGSSAWLVSRMDRQTSNIGWDIGAATAASIVSFPLAGWPRTGQRKGMAAWRRNAPVWLVPLAATVAASATRARR